MSVRESLGLAGVLLVLTSCVALLSASNRSEETSGARQTAVDAAAAAQPEELPEQCKSCLMNSFSTFDRAYIPALALTKMGSQAQAERAMAQLRKTWEGVRPMLCECRQQWEPELDHVEAAITAAERVLAEDKAAEAHEELEVIRDQLMALRKSQGIVYDLDPLNEFHTVMEAIVKPATDMQASDVDAECKSRFRKLSAEARTAWKAVQTTRFADGPFLLNAERAEQLEKLIQAETRALADFGTALQGEDAEAILKTARGLKPAFAKVYMFFGKFPSSE